MVYSKKTDTLHGLMAWNRTGSCSVVIPLKLKWLTWGFWYFFTKRSQRIAVSKCKIAPSKKKKKNEMHEIGKSMVLTLMEGKQILMNHRTDLLENRLQGVFGGQSNKLGWNCYIKHRPPLVSIDMIDRYEYSLSGCATSISDFILKFLFEVKSLWSVKICFIVDKMGHLTFTK